MSIATTPFTPNTPENMEKARIAEAKARQELDMAFRRACAENDVGQAKDLLARGANPKAPHGTAPGGHGCLSSAIGQGSLDAAKWLLELDSELAVNGCGGALPMTVAAYAGNTEAIDLLAPFAPVIGLDRGHTPLMFAAGRSHLLAAQKIFELGGLPAVREIYAAGPHTPLTWALAERASLDMIAWLLPLSDLAWTPEPQSARVSGNRFGQTGPALAVAAFSVARAGSPRSVTAQQQAFDLVWAACNGAQRAAATSWAQGLTPQTAAEAAEKLGALDCLLANQPAERRVEEVERALANYFDGVDVQSAMPRAWVVYHANNEARDLRVAADEGRARAFSPSGGAGHNPSALMAAVASRL